MDTWLLVRDIEVSGERNRGLYVLKARGMSHSNQIREFISERQGHQAGRGLSRPGRDAYRFGAGGARRAGARRSECGSLTRRELKLAQLEHKRKAMEAQIEAMRAEFEADAAAK